VQCVFTRETITKLTVRGSATSGWSEMISAACRVTCGGGHANVALDGAYHSRWATRHSQDRGGGQARRFRAAACFCDTNATAGIHRISTPRACAACSPRFLQANTQDSSASAGFIMPDCWPGTLQPAQGRRWTSAVASMDGFQSGLKPVHHYGPIDSLARVPTNRLDHNDGQAQAVTPPAKNCCLWQGTTFLDV